MAGADREANSLEEMAAELLREVTGLPDVLFVMGKGPQAVMEGWVDRTKTQVRVQGEWVAVESERWHCHLGLPAVARLRFVEQEDAHDPARQAFSIRFLNRDGEPLLMVFFGEMYDDNGALRADRVARFRDLQGRYASSGPA